MSEVPGPILVVFWLAVAWIVLVIGVLLISSAMLAVTWILEKVGL